MTKITNIYLNKNFPFFKIFTKEELIENELNIDVYATMRDYFCFEI